MSEIIKKDLSEIIDLIRKKEIKSEELANLYIDKVNKSKKLNSYILLVLNTLSKNQKNSIKNQILTYYFQEFH